MLRITAVVVLTAPLAIGLSFFSGCSLSFVLSERSFMM